MQNVGMYLAACEGLGIAGFAAEDLCGDGDVRNVLTNLIEFAGAAQEAGLAPLDLDAPEEEAPPPVKAAPPVVVAAPAPKSVPAPKVEPTKQAARPAKVGGAPVPSIIAPPAAPAAAPVSPHSDGAKLPARLSPRGARIGAAAPVSPRIVARARPVEVEPEPEVDDGATRSRGETASLLNWQPPTSGADEALKLENTRLKAQAERANLSATTQTKLKDDALAKLAKEKDKVRELEESLEAERKKKTDAAPAAAAASAMEALKRTVDELKAKLAIAEQERAEFEELVLAKDEAVTEAEKNAKQLEEQLKSLRAEMQVREAQFQKDLRQQEDDALFLTAELNKLKEAQGSADDETAALKSEIVALKASAEKERKSADEEVSALKSLQKLQKNDSSNAELALVKGKLAKLEDEKKESDSELVALKSELAVVKARAESAAKSPRSVDKPASPRGVAPVAKSAPAAKAAPKVSAPLPSAAANKLLESVDELDIAFAAPAAAPKKPTGGPSVTASASASGDSDMVGLLEGKPSKLNAAAFESESNRKALAEAMKKVLKKQVGANKVSDFADKSFDNLADILRVVLQKLDPESPEDFKCAKKVLKLGSLVRRGKTKLLREVICDFPVWSEPIFWDDLCAATIAKVFEKDPDRDPNEAVRETLSSIGRSMSAWCVSEDVIREVVSHGAENEGLSNEEADEILADVLGTEGAPAAKKPSPAAARGYNNNAAPDDDDEQGDAGAGAAAAGKSGPLKFKKASKWIKANFTLRGNTLSYDYMEEGIGEFSEDLVLTGGHEATPGSDQAPGALRNYSFKISCAADKSVLHLLAAKQPEVMEWITAINDCPACRAGGGGGSGGGVSAGKAPVPASPRGKAGSDAIKTVPAKKVAVPARPHTAKEGSTRPAGGDDLRKGSQPPVRVQRSETQQQRLVKEGDVKMLVAKRWLRTHVELFDNCIVLTYVNPDSNTDQVREEIPLPRMLIAPNSPLAPAALKDSSWRIKDGEDEHHLMSSSK